MAEFSPDMLPDLLPLYYSRLFPYGPYYKWLSYGNVKPSCFQNREFSFTLADDVYIRYLSFNNQGDLEKAIQKRCPYKIDIGAIYTTRPTDHRRAGVFTPVEKELVFDIDMTDYDEIRTCCSGADICTKCWRFMTVGTKVLDTALRDDFGFEHLLWVFSGRRGIHCWVCDASARALNQSARSAVAEYLQVVAGGENQSKKVTILGDIMHPSIKRAVSIIEQEFDTIVEEQDIFGSKDSVAKMLKLIVDESLRNEAEKTMDNHNTSKQRWKALVKVTKDFYAKNMQKRRNKFVIEEIMLQYAYPRLDIHVSKGINHLLKSPFCIHPKTGKVCTPFNPRAVGKFNPTTVPTISQIIEEVRQYDDKQGELMKEKDKISRVKDYKKTSVIKSVTVFNEFVRNLETTWKGTKIEASVVCMWFLFWIDNVLGLSSFTRQDDICGMHNGRRLYLEQGDHGILTAKNVTLSPHAHLSSLQSHEQCNLEIVTCPSCVIVVRFHHLSLSPQCGGGVMDSPCRCDYVWLSEPPYDEVSGSPFCGHFTSPSATPVYHSQTRTLVLALFYSQAHKHAFTLEYSSERNRHIIKGIPGHGTVVGGNVSAGGFITSPFFPAQYPRDLGAEYVINCQANLTLGCKVRLIFSDFQLAGASVMEFYDWNGQRLEVTSGTSFRPSVILSSGPSLLVRFYANGGSGIGYKASYSFLSGSYDEKAVKPITDCGGFVENLGGAITMMNMVKRGRPAKMYDCIWLIRPPSSFYHLKTHLYLKVATFLDMGGSTELIVRQGLTSDGPVLETMRHPVTAIGLTRPKREHILPLNVGFYVSLRGSFSSASRLAILYAAFTYMDCYTGSDFLCQNHRCIPAQLSCDGFDHCGDNSDEPDTCTREWEMEPVDRRWYSHTPNYYFPKMERYPDLKTATLIFVISSLGLIFLIAALVVLLYRMGSRARQQRELHNRLQTISELLDGARIEEVQTDEPPVYEAPPDYEEVIKRRNISQKRKKKNRNRSRSSPGSLQIIQAATSSRRLEVSLPQVSSSPQYRPLSPTPLNTSAINRSCQVTPIPDSPPPPYSDNLSPSQTPTLLPEESAELNEWEQRTNGTFNCSEHIEPLVSLIVTSPVPTPDLPETCQLLSVTTNSNDESQDLTTNSLISIDCNSHDDDVFYKEKESSPSMTANSLNIQDSNETVFKRILRRPQRSRRNVYSLDVSHLTRLYDIKCQCEGACGCSTIGQIIRPLSAELKRTAATWSPSSYNLQALDIYLSQTDMGLHAPKQRPGSPFHVLKSVPKGSPLTLSISASADNLKDLV